jgi:hypothetical protein
MPYDEAGNRDRVAALRQKGVDVWGPERVYIADDVNLDWIEPGAEIRHATLAGSRLRIGRGVRVGTTGHALVEDCQIAARVTLGAGSFQGATLLEGASVRGFAELRPGTLLEEDTEAAHTVALKNTILTAGCVTGSVINYCDVFMSGGTSRDDHCEVGSGAIHFNFDPRGDKWGSLAGDARGLLLRSAPVFVGGQCGIVGPAHIDFGAVTAAGSVIRKDVGADIVSFEGVGNSEITGFDREIYAGLKRKFLTTAKLIGNLWAFDRWYETIRLPHATDEERPFFEAARGQASIHIDERVSRLGKIIAKLPRSIEKSTAGGDLNIQRYRDEHRTLMKCWPLLGGLLSKKPETPQPPAAFARAYGESRASGKNHVAAVQSSDAGAAETTAWLLQIAEDVRQKTAWIFGSTDSS